MEDDVTDKSTDECVEESKRLAQGPLGDYISRYPLMFAMSVLISWRDEQGGKVSLNNGTVTMIRLAGRQVGVTCSHVIKKYFEVASKHSAARFQIGNQKIDLPDRIIDRSEDLDLAVLDLSEFLPNSATHSEIGCSFFEPREWPPKLPTTENVVEIGGFPGALRKQTGPKDLGFGTFSVGKAQVASVSPSKLVVQLHREYWVEHPGFASGLHVRSLFGISGGPVTIEWTRPSGLWVVDLVGIVFEYSADFDLVYARPLTLICEDGSIMSSLEVP